MEQTENTASWNERQREARPNAVTVGLAVALAVCAALLALVGLTEPDGLAQRMLFLAALVLTTGDVLDGAGLARRDTARIRDAHAWVFAFYMGSFWVVGVALLMHPAAFVPAVWLPAAVVFGLIMGLTPLGGGRKASSTRYDLEFPRTDTPGGRVMYFGWPFVYLAVVAGLWAFPPDDGWQPDYVMFQAVFLMGLVPLYGPRRDLPALWFGGWPKIAGRGLLVLALAAF